jgi:hypothetical protein
VDHMPDTFSLISHDVADAVAATARHCIFKVSVAVVLTYDFPREKTRGSTRVVSSDSPKPTATLPTGTKVSFLSASPLPRLRGDPHTKRDQSQIVRCPGPLPCTAKTPYLEFGSG